MPFAAILGDLVYEVWGAGWGAGCGDYGLVVGLSEAGDGEAEAGGAAGYEPG